MRQKAVFEYRDNTLHQGSQNRFCGFRDILPKGLEVPPIRDAASLLRKSPDGAAIPLPGEMIFGSHKHWVSQCRY